MAAQRILLLADVHLSADSPAQAQHFFSFLRGVDAPAVAALYILGDLLDVWLGDDDDTPLAAQLRQELKALRQRGVALFIQHGNRDFMLGMRFMTACGATLLPQAHCLESGGGRWLLMHGDSLVADAAYLKYRRRIRHPLVRAAAAALPLVVRRRLAARMRAASRGNVEQAVLDEALAAAELRRHACRHLIHGHLHRGGEQRWQNGGEEYSRTCLPAWDAAGGGVGEIAEGKLRLRQVKMGNVGDDETGG